jgi:hypothetical protein
MRTLTKLLLAAALAVAVGCGDDDGGNGPSDGLQPSTTYRGVITATNGESAALAITFASPVSLREGRGASLVLSAVTSATGTVETGTGSTIPISGSIDGTALTMSGEGIALSGTLLEGQLTGTATGVGFSGIFAALSSTSADPARAYCGTFAGTQLDLEGGIETGTFNLVVAGGVLQGSSAGVDGVFPFTGTATDQNGTISIDIDETLPSGSIVASGTTSDDYARITGTYRTSDPQGAPVVNGTFAGAVCPDRPEDALIGTWHATKIVYTSVANPATKVDVIALGGSYSVVLFADGSSTFSYTAPGSQSPAVGDGDWSAHGSLLLLTTTGTITLQYTYALTGSTLSLSGASAGYDFDGDGQLEPTTIDGTLVKQ